MHLSLLWSEILLIKFFKKCEHLHRKNITLAKNVPKFVVKSSIFQFKKKKKFFFKNYMLLVQKLPV